MSLSTEQFEKVREHTLACYPQEMCGIITTEEEFVPLTNIHEKPEESFTIAPTELVPYLGKVKYILHSHCRDIRTPEVFDLRTPSYPDTIGQKKSGIPWLIVSCEGVTVTQPIQIPRVKNNEYLERPFIWFINDCYSLVQDYYWFEFGIDLPNHKAEEDYANVRKTNNLFDSYIEEYGFVEVSLKEQLVNGDLLLIDNGNGTKNHLGIYDGNGFVLHQGILSIKEQLEHFIGKIHKVLRYANKSL